MRLHLEYAHTLDPALWSARHASGLVPDRYPYGLDRLEGHGFELRTASPPRGIVSFLDGVARRASGGFDLVQAFSDRTRRECEAAICWDERSGVPAALRSQLPGEPEAVLGVIWLTEPDAPIGPRGRRLAQRALRKAAGVWAMSPAQLSVLERDWHVEARRLYLLHMGIDTNFWHAMDDVEVEPGLVVGAGNDRHRDHRLLVEAVARLRRSRPNVRLELVTHHPVDVPPELGRRHTHLSHSAMRDLYSRASVVALALKPNLHLSGLSVLLESMACSRPIVITDSPGLSEYARHDENSLVVPPQDVDELAGAIEALLSDRDRAEAIATSSRGASEEFSTEAQAAQLKEIVEDALA